MLFDLFWLIIGIRVITWNAIAFQHQISLNFISIPTKKLENNTSQRPRTLLLKRNTRETFKSTNRQFLWK